MIRDDDDGASARDVYESAAASAGPIHADQVRDAAADLGAILVAAAARPRSPFAPLVPDAVLDTSVYELAIAVARTKSTWCQRMTEWARSPELEIPLRRLTSATIVAWYEGRRLRGGARPSDSTLSSAVTQIRAPLVIIERAYRLPDEVALHVRAILADGGNLQGHYRFVEEDENSVLRLFERE